jgi:hypothetical protein
MQPLTMRLSEYRQPMGAEGHSMEHEDGSYHVCEPTRQRRSSSANRSAAASRASLSLRSALVDDVWKSRFAVERSWPYEPRLSDHMPRCALVLRRIAAIIDELYALYAEIKLSSRRSTASRMQE